MKYKVERTCGDCKNIDSFKLSKIEAAFELYDSSEIWKTPCSKCGSTNCESIGHYGPKLDKELLDIWGNDAKLHLMPQDEELILAEFENLSSILNAIDECKYLKRKLDVLIEALCVLLYDNTVSDEGFSNKENIERQKIADAVRPELVKRKAKIVDAEDSIMDYIKKVVFPQIGIKRA